MSEPKPERSAIAHFSTGILVVAAIGLFSWFLHSHALLRNLEMTNLDVLFLSQSRPPESPRIAVVSITEDDYRDLFKSTSPLSQATILDLIRACALSGASIIAIDLDTSDWTAEQRTSVTAAVASATPKGADLPRLVWAVGGYEDPGTRTSHLEVLQGLDAPGCEGVPASMPDEYGVVRGYKPSMEDTQTNPKRIVGNLAFVVEQLWAHPTAPCDPPGYSIPPPADTSEGEKLVNYRGGGVSFPHLSAKTVLGAATAEAWRNSNPLQKRIALIGGAYRAARDKYVTPVGYLDGVDILALTMTSIEKGIGAPTPRVFLVIDLTLGMLLLTATWFLHRTWVLLLTFVLIPFLAILLSIAAFSTSGYFFSFVPILTGILLHRLVEFLWEHAKKHREMSQELARLRKAHEA